MYVSLFKTLNDPLLKQVYHVIKIILYNTYTWQRKLGSSATWKRGSSVVRHLPLVLEVPGSIPARGEKNFGVRTHFL